MGESHINRKSLNIMEWTQLSLPKPKTTRPQVGELSSLDHWKVILASRAIKKSVAAILQTAVLSYLESNWDECEQRLSIEAGEQGLTLEEYAQHLISAQAR